MITIGRPLYKTVGRVVGKGAFFGSGANTNNAPTDIALSVSDIDEFQAIGSVVGAFSTVDADVGDTFSYTLVSGTGDTDNSSFTIDAANLKTAEVFDVLFPTEKSSYSIRVRSTDAGGLSTEKAFTITVNQVQPEAGLTNLLDLGLPSSNIDARLIYHAFTLDTKTEAGQETPTLINIVGNEDPTSASSDARDKLEIDNYVIIAYNQGYTG